MKNIRVMLEAAQKDDLVKTLDKLLGPDDQAWFVCSFTDCTSNINGRCAIYTIAAPPRTCSGKPCEHYEKRA